MTVRVTTHNDAPASATPRATAHAEPAGSPREEGGSQLVVCVGVMLLTCVRV